MLNQDAKISKAIVKMYDKTDAADTSVPCRQRSIQISKKTYSELLESQNEK
jgi:hypothetical protein